MSPTPVDDHTEEFEQLAGLHALEVLEGDELRRFEEHAAQCQRCRLMVKLDREALALAAPEMEPSADFKARLMQRAAQELAVTREPIPLQPRITAPPNVLPFRRRSPWMQLIAAVFVVGIVTAGGYAYENQVVATYALSGSVQGSAVVNVRRSGAAELEMRGVPNPPPGYLYEAWIIPADGKPVPAGVTPQGDAQFGLQSVASGSTVAITRETRREEAPTSAPIMQVVVES
jgi:anti-sigma-K factor RskA